MLRRSGLTALVVGTVLVLINQGVALAAGEFRSTLVWQIPLTYAVPFCVASWARLATTEGKHVELRGLRDHKRNCAQSVRRVRARTAYPDQPRAEAAADHDRHPSVIRDDTGRGDECGLRDVPAEQHHRLRRLPAEGGADQPRTGTPVAASHRL